jgi:hypothetical protein
MERMIADALDGARIRFRRADKTAAGMDFYLPDFDLYIEVKQFHSDRIAAQTSRAPNVIVAQGAGAVSTLAALIALAGGLKAARS